MAGEKIQQVIDAETLTDKEQDEIDKMIRESRKKKKLASEFHL